MVLMWRSIPAVSYRLIYGGIGREVVVAGGGEGGPLQTIPQKS